MVPFPMRKRNSSRAPATREQPLLSSSCSFHSYSSPSTTHKKPYGRLWQRFKRSFGKTRYLRLTRGMEAAVSGSTPSHTYWSKDTLQCDTPTKKEKSAWKIFGYWRKMHGQSKETSSADLSKRWSADTGRYSDYEVQIWRSFYSLPGAF